MELLLILGGLCLLGLLALRFGYDSRDGFRSDEQVMATLGFTWDSKRREPHHPPRLRPAHALRHRLATGLTALADWLYPVGHTREV